MKIQIESKPFAVDYWYSGIYTKNEKEFYEFTIYENSSQATEITWVDETPFEENRLAELEKQIIKQFEKNL